MQYTCNTHTIQALHEFRLHTFTIESGYDIPRAGGLLFKCSGSLRIRSHCVRAVPDRAWKRY